MSEAESIEINKTSTLFILLDHQVYEDRLNRPLPSLIFAIMERDGEHN